MLTRIKCSSGCGFPERGYWIIGSGSLLNLVRALGCVRVLFLPSHQCGSPCGFCFCSRISGGNIFNRKLPAYPDDHKIQIAFSSALPPLSVWTIPEDHRDQKIRFQRFQFPYSPRRLQSGTR